MTTRIEDTRAYFIEKYGKPYEKMVDGKKYKFVNSSLISYDELINYFSLICEKFGKEIKDCYIEILSDFAVVDGMAYIDNVNNKLKNILMKKNNTVTKNSFLNFLEEIETFYSEENYDPREIIKIFQNVLKVPGIYNKGTIKNYL